MQRFHSLSLPMKMRLASLILCPLICALHASAAIADTTIQSWDGVKAAIKTQEARKLLDLETNFDTRLPAGFTSAFLVQQLAPGQDPRRMVLSAAKAWPLRPNSYVAMVCLTNPAGAAGATQDGPGYCVGDNIWFGVFETTGGGVPKLVARTDGPVATPTDWSDTDIVLPDAVKARDPKDGALSVPTSWNQFDLAPYQIKSGEYAFGVRASWLEPGFADGGSGFEALYLFRVEGKSLRVVFARPMSDYEIYVSEWNGTHSYDVGDASNSLVILPGQTGGFHDIQLRQQAGKWLRTFRWSSARQRYE
jgi:hypothetical protein